MPTGLTDFDQLPPVGRRLVQVAVSLGWKPKDFGFGLGAYHIHFTDQFGNESTINFGREGFYPRDGRVWTTLRNAPPPSFICEMDDDDELTKFVSDCLNAWYQPDHDKIVYFDDKGNPPDNDDLEPA